MIVMIKILVIKVKNNNFGIFIFLNFLKIIGIFNLYLNQINFY